MVTCLARSAEAARRFEETRTRLILSRFNVSLSPSLRAALVAVRNVERNVSNASAHPTSFARRIFSYGPPFDLDIYIYTYIYI